MKVIVFDAETTIQLINEKIIDNSPFNPKNRMVSGHWLKIDVDPSDVEQLREALKNIDLCRNTMVQHSVFHHAEVRYGDSPNDLQRDLDEADMLVAHNAKFDVQWLRQCGFRLPKSTYCTMIGEYVFARGLPNVGLSLYDSAIRRGVTAKKSDLVDDLFNKGKGQGFEEMPLDTVIEYAEADVLSCAEIFVHQLIDLHEEENRSLRNIVELMNDMLEFIVEIETNGIHIDLDALDEVEQEFVAEKAALEKRLQEIVEEVMGDTPINLASGADLSKVIYSREVTDKDLHKKMFNIGTQANGKPKYPPKMKKTEFAAAVRATTKVLHKTVAVCCHVCRGKGKVYKRKKNGEPYKNPNNCKECGGSGVLYDNTGRKAGLRLVPKGPRDASVHGFKADGDTIKLLIHQAEEKDRLVAVEFLTKLARLNAVSTYLASFVGGIKTYTRENSILHSNFNQCVASTGRLSSSKPNFQNMPQGGKFPIRKAVTSRFKGGVILEADFSGLEFRVAGELSRDEQIIADVLNGKDIHRQTSSIINECSVEAITKDMRQGAKPYSFAPLYGGMGANEPPHIQKYFSEFFQIYKGMAAQQKRWCDAALTKGIVQTPSGRQYAFKNIRRLRSGRITNQTNVVNYPVQGFATGDCVPLACVRALREFRRLGLKSLLILTVHDSIVVDVYPGELEAVKEALFWAMTRMPEEVKERWGYQFVLPLAVEMEAGVNWMVKEELELPQEEAPTTPVSTEQQPEDEFAL